MALHSLQLLRPGLTVCVSALWFPETWSHTRPWAHSPLVKLQNENYPNLHQLYTCMREEHKTDFSGVQSLFLLLLWDGEIWEMLPKSQQDSHKRHEYKEYFLEGMIWYRNIGSKINLSLARPTTKQPLAELSSQQHTWTHVCLYVTIDMDTSI